MTIYQNPWVSREVYFVKTGAARSAKMEASKSKGFIVEFINGQWRVTEGQFYNQSLREMPIVAENKVSIQSVIERAILNAVLDLVGETKIDHPAEKGGAEE